MSFERSGILFLPKGMPKPKKAYQEVFGTPAQRVVVKCHRCGNYLELKGESKAPICQGCKGALAELAMKYQNTSAGNLPPGMARLSGGSAPVTKRVRAVPIVAGR